MSDRAGFPCVAHVLFFDADGRLALFRRANTGFMDGWYGLPGGHQEPGESVEAAAVRECEEETGVVPRSLAPVAVLPYRSGRHQGVNFVFSCRQWCGELAPAENAFDDMAWFTTNALPERVVPWLADVLGLAERGEWFLELAY